MEHIKSFDETDKLLTNDIIFENNKDSVSFVNSNLIFKGKNNLLYLEDGVILQDTNIVFEGNNNVIYLCKNKHKYLLNLTLYNNSVFYMGENNYINGKINAILSEEKHIIIGDNCLLSFGIFMRLADPHLIYSIDTRKRKNYSKSIFIGDHVWIGQNAMILKNTQIGSGSIVGGMSVVAGKKIPSNTSWAGNPAKQIADNIFFTSACVHSYQKKETKKSETFESDEFIFNNIKNKSDKSALFDQFDKDLSSENDPHKKLLYIKENIRNNKDKYRFSIPTENRKSNLLKKIFKV